MRVAYRSTWTTFSNSDPLHRSCLIYRTLWFISLFWQYRRLEGVGLNWKGFGRTKSWPTRRTILVFASTDLQAPTQGTRVIGDIQNGNLSVVTATPNHSVCHAPLLIRRHIRLLEDIRTCITVLNTFRYSNITKNNLIFPSLCKRNHFMSWPNKDFIQRKVSEKIQSDYLTVCKYGRIRPNAWILRLPQTFQSIVNNV
jgi:hypothetical protein